MASRLEKEWGKPIRESADDNTVITQAFRELERIARKYKKYEQAGKDMRGGPDTSRFIAPSYGFIKPFGNEWTTSKHGNSVLVVIGMKIGTSFALRPYRERDDADQLAAVKERGNVVKQVEEEVKKVLVGVQKQIPSLFFEPFSTGTAWGFVGLSRQER